MLARLIQKFGRVAYRHPHIPQDKAGAGSFGNLKIALLADYFTSVCLASECRIRSLTPENYEDVLKFWHPDMVFVESAFHGVGDEWRYMLAKQPRYMRFKPSPVIGRLVALARELRIPAIFWNKDDAPFFDAFIDVARHFSFVFTTDADCLPRYARELPAGHQAHVLAMAYEPAFHNFTGFGFELNEACFVGSYYRKILQRRRRFLDMIFDACSVTGVPLHVYDRNSNRFSHFFEFRFPTGGTITMHPKVAYPDTATIFKRYSISINVNSVNSATTMYSRRMLEILACGGICVTNHTQAAANEFGSFCHMVSTAEEALETLSRLAFGPNEKDREMAAAGAEYVASTHTWECRLEQLADIVNF